MYEFSIARNILGNREPSLLMTDGYKFAMAQAGFPLRTETFYMTFRHGGPWYIPFDLEKIVEAFLPNLPKDAEKNFLEKSGYRPTPAMRVALYQGLKVVIRAAPKGSWVLAKEPILTITGPSFLVSWLEPLVLMLHFPIQVATEALKGRKEFPCTCRDEMGIVAETLEVTLSSLAGLQLTDESVQYRADVAKRLASLINALEDKDPKRIFEVGMRACTCMAMHRIALEECKKAGITATSNVFLANELDMVAVGTTGHEHIQRWGDDLTACRAMRDMRPQRPSCLPDTFDAMGLGLPAALLSFLEQPNREGTVRFDSGDQKPQLYAVEGVSQKLLLNKPNYIFEDGIDEQKIIRDEDWCRELGIAPERRAFGSGQFIVRAEFTYMTRDRVAAVYKLCKTGDLPVMKTCATAPTKASVPGVPVTFRRVRVGACDQAYNSFAGLIGQEGETPPVGFVSLDSRLGKPDFPVDPMEVGFSPETEKLIGDCLKRIADSQSL